MPKSPATITLDFNKVAEHYGIKPTQKMQRAVLKAMINHAYMTPLKAAQQNVELVNVAHGTLTKTVSILRERGVPIEAKRQVDSGGRRYTEYHLDRAKVQEDMAAHI